MLKARWCKDTDLMHMLRCLFIFEASFGFTLTAKHIPGIHNELADDLSRNRTASFLSKVPAASPTASRVHPEIIEMVARQQPDWTSQSWINTFSSVLKKV